MSSIHAELLSHCKGSRYNEKWKKDIQEYSLKTTQCLSTLEWK